SRHRVSQARGIHGLVGERADQGSGAARCRDQGSGCRGEIRSARAGQCLDPAALGEAYRWVWFAGSGWRRRLPPACSSASSGAVAAAFAASAEKGKTAYIQHGCWQCHGMQAQGGVTGPKLAPDPIPVETFTAFVRTTNRAMPPYSEAILSNDDLADIHAYLQTIPKPADHKSIPLLNQ